MVVDASIVIEALVSSAPIGDRARGLLTGAAQLIAPHLLDVEVMSGIRRLQARQSVDADLATTSIGQLERLPIDRFPHQPLLGRMWALRDSVSAYDATYVALAEAIDLPLVTLDARLAKTPGIPCEVVLLA